MLNIESFMLDIDTCSENLENYCPLTNSERSSKVVLFQNNGDRLHL